MVEELLSADLWIKLLLAFACGAAIGLERELSDKPAGLRTNMLICVGSTLITMVSLHVALTYASLQTNVADPGRIAAQIVSGVGFLGAGTIIQSRGSVHGLTTAATIWVMAGVGLAIGSGAYAPALATTVVLLAILVLLERLEMALLTRRRHFVHFQVHGPRERGLVGRINAIAAERGLFLDDVRVSRRGESVVAEFALTCSSRTRDGLVEELIGDQAVDDIRLSE